MKKKVIVSIIVFSCVMAVFVFLGIIPVNSLFNKDDNELSINKAAKVIKENFSTDVICYGDAIDFSCDLGVRYIEEVTEDTIKSDTESEYQVLIINDLENVVELSDSEIDLLSKKISSDGFALIYLGEKYDTVWNSKEGMLASVKGNLAYMYYSINGEARRNIGAWNETDSLYLEENPCLLGDSITYLIETYLYENN